MGRLFWILIGVLGIALIALILNHDSGTVFGMNSGRFASFAMMSVLAVFIAGAAFGGGTSLSTTIKHLAIWVAIILALMTGYIFRFDLQDVGARLTGGLIPGSPISRMSENGSKEVVLIRSPNGHFEASATINGQDARFLVDTGASGIVLSAADAQRAGLDVSRLSYTIITQTANGRGRAADARIDSLRLGSIERRNVRVSVVESGKLSQSLLGQDFLESLSSYEKRGDRLTLRD